MKTAIRFFKSRSEEYRVDTTHIFIGGESAEGITAMAAGYVDKQSELAAYPNSEPNNVEGYSGTPGYSSEVQGVLCLCADIPDMDSTVNYMSHFMYSLITGETPPPLKKAPPPIQVADIIQDNMVIQQSEPFKSVNARFRTSPQDNLSGGKWKVCSPEKAGNFSAMAYFFGKLIHQQLNVPVGLLVLDFLQKFCTQPCITTAQYIL